MHRKNRYYLEGKTKWTSVEKDKFILFNVLFLIFLAWAAFCCFTIRYSPQSWNPPSYLLAVLLGLVILCFCFVNLLEFFKARILTRNAKLIAGKISGHKFTEKSDTRHIILYYAFTKPNGETADGATKEVAWYDSQYFPKVKLRLLSYEKKLEPVFDDFVIVQLVEGENPPEDDVFDVL